MVKYLQRENDANDNAVASINISDSPDEENNVARKPRKQGSVIWNFFEKCKANSSAKCCTCGKIYKTSGNTSNLFDHIKRSHPTQLETSNSKTNIYRFFKPAESDSYGYYSVKKGQIDAALARMIAVDVQPFRVVEDKRYKLPCRRSLEEVHMKNMFSSLQKKLKELLANIECCAITTDGWSSRGNEHYLTVTCHFITSELKLQSAVLSTTKLQSDENHSADNIAGSLRAVLHEWDVFEKVSTIVTDNVANMLKACEILQKRNLPCFAHCLNLIAQDTLSLDCIKGITGKCKRIVAFFKSSTTAYAKFRSAQGIERPYSLVQEVSRRWSSAYRMIKRILLTKDAIAVVLLNTTKAPAALTADDICILDLVDLLAPLDNATTQVSASQSVTVSLLIPTISELHQNYHDLYSKMKTTEGKSICLFLIERLIHRLSKFETRTVTRVATLLDARFKKEGFRSANNAAVDERVIPPTPPNLSQPQP
ncbi:PREDICTED: zinc finger BED domain-containing protein 1-like isoform X2 [Rhagoletis zephyria]|uniref:zinc finger BED domain-containing protein 1-like isoform X2 n=1 Tax=Rhagoletis zephyria TaxID=28612 RepID=UPI0008113C45|nr:PREDICTED: zinc finger BED domain-containing protein 1-like isoform X2 [Rhagoletis zephyria]